MRRALFSILCGFLAACGDAGDGARSTAATEDAASLQGQMTLPPIPPGVERADVERGRELFPPCAVCHGLEAEGTRLGPPLRDAEWIHIDGSLEEIERIIAEGAPASERYPVPMGPMGGGDFDADELRAVASYVYALSR